MTPTDIAIPTNELRLSGTLAGTDPMDRRPAALLISGSGPVDRDTNARRLRLDVMGRLAAHLETAGIASLRYDKRGVGASQGDYPSTGFHDNVADARAALRTLRSQPGVDPTRLVVVGHSEGALIASQLATDEDVAGVVLLAGAAQTGKAVLRWQAGQVEATLPRPVRWVLRVLRRDLASIQAKRLQRIERSTDDVIRIQLVKLNARWFREFMAFDPAESLRNARVPVLAITGDKDIQVDPGDIATMERLVPTEFTGHVLADVTHVLRREPGRPTLKTYKRQGRQPLDRRVLDLATSWIREHTRTANGADHERV